MLLCLCIQAIQALAALAPTHAGAASCPQLNEWFCDWGGHLLHSFSGENWL